MNFENTQTWGFVHAMRGMRNPKDSWHKNDTYCGTAPPPGAQHWYCTGVDTNEVVAIGENDLALAQRLIAGGSEHRKFMRQIFVSVDITAPQYWWKEFDTYKVGTTANSTSTMHTLTNKPITPEHFEGGTSTITDAPEEWRGMMINFYAYLEWLRSEFVKTGNPRYWKMLIQLLPESFLYKRTVTMNYENLLNIYHQRRHHKLSEWSGDGGELGFCDWVASLPYAVELLGVKPE